MTLLVPLPVTEVKPVVLPKVKVPLATDKVTCSTLPSVVLKAIALLLPEENVNVEFSLTV